MNVAELKTYFQAIELIDANMKVYISFRDGDIQHEVAEDSSVTDD